MILRAQEHKVARQPSFGQLPRILDRLYLVQQLASSLLLVCCTLLVNTFLIVARVYYKNGFTPEIR